MNKITEMYFDSFANAYVLKPDPYAPPERYVLTMRGSKGVYIDHWGGEKNGVPGFVMDVAYSSEEYYSEIHDIRFFDMCKEQGFTATHLRYFTLPEEKFDEYLSRFDLQEGDTE